MSLIQVLHDIIGVYSAHPTAPLSLHARVMSFSEHEFYVLDDSRMVYRVPAMRESVYMVPRETAHLAMSATLHPPSDPYWHKRYSQKGRVIPEEKYAGWKKAVIQVTDYPLTLGQINEATEIPHESLKAVLNRKAFEGELLRVGAKSLRSNIIQYVSWSSWAGEDFIHTDSEKAIIWLAGEDFIHTDSEKAIIWLAGEYLKVFGPIRVKDFQWWSGVTITRAKEAISAHNIVTLDNDYLLLQSDLPDFENTRFREKDCVDILPQWDSYTMGYAPDGRERFVSSETQDKLYGSIGATGGNSFGTILVNGLAYGTWSFRFKGHQMNISVEMFDKPSTNLNSNVLKEFEQIGTLLQAKELKVHYV